MNSIDKATRLTNYLIDLVLVVIGWIFALLVAGAYINDILLFYILTFAYYFILENLMQQTVGKRVTRTKVVDKHGERPSVFRIFLRSIWLLFPLDAYSYLFGSDYGMHDMLSATRLVRKISIR